MERSSHEKEANLISCGRFTEEEKSLRILLKTLIDSKDAFQSYFAETVQDLNALAHNVFEGVRLCSGPRYTNNAINGSKR
jgi:hypothetical protein